MTPSFRTTPPGHQIGFRRNRGGWQDDLSALVAFAQRERFAFLDFGPIDVATARCVLDAGCQIGTVDLPNWPGMIAADPGLRHAAVISNASYMRAMAALGIRSFLTVLTPSDPARPRKENFAVAVETYRELASAADECGASILIEGAPGRPPHFANLCCTPGDLRAFFQQVDSSAMGVNFDPSHLLRMGIDVVAFLREFGVRVGHVHAKDTLLFDEELYVHGRLQQATFAEPHVYGGHGWRYVLPGRGNVPWVAVFASLQEQQYGGKVSIELEDADYLADEASQQRGFREAADFLQGPRCLPKPSVAIGPVART